MSTIKHLTYKHIHTTILEMVEMLKKAEYTPQVIMPVAKGGLIPAGLLGQYYPDALFYIIQTKGYLGVDKKHDSVKVFIPKSIKRDIDKNAKILIVDDIYDTGRTITEIIKVLKENGVKNNIATATLYHKQEADGTPDFFCRTVKKGTWINFPWELKI
jgi:hypoxanthine phosphoribosyltransferase